MWATIAMGLTLTMSGCGGDAEPDSAAGGGDGELAGATLTVGSKEFTESILSAGSPPWRWRTRIRGTGPARGTPSAPP
jgi:hypothetical protein